VALGVRESQYPRMANAEDLERVTSLVLQFLESKAFFNAERALRAELALALQSYEAQGNEARQARLPLSPRGAGASARPEPT
jgi:hypothetical protein